jgi:hypothetical protein
MSDIYKRASKFGLRFQSPQGLLTVEDLWRIPLQSARGGTNLDDVSKALNKKLKNDDSDFSLIDKEKQSDPLVQLQFDIVKDIIESRLAERDEKAKEKDEAERRQKIMGIIAEKKDQNLLNMPIEELEKLLNNK